MSRERLLDELSDESPSGGESPAYAEREARAFVMELGALLHGSGATAGRLEDALRSAAEELGLRAQVFSTPTSLMIAFGEAGAQSTQLVRVAPGDVHLEKLALVDAVATRVGRGLLTTRDGRRELRRIVEAPNRYSTPLLIVAQALITGAAARLFSGGLADIVAAAALGAMVGVITAVFHRHEHGSRIVDFAAGVTAAAGAVMIDRFVAPVSTYTVTLAAIIVLVPGLTLTVSMSELATRNLVSGTARLMGGLMILVSLGFGVAVGRHVEAVLPGSSTAAKATELFGEPGKAAAIVVVGFMLAIVFRARPRDIGPIVIGSAIGVYGARLGAAAFSPEIGAALGALALGLASNVWSRVRNQPSAITTIPGLILLVPGSIGFGGLNALLADDTVTGVDTFFTMTLVGVSIVAGLLLANVVYRGRRGV